MLMMKNLCQINLQMLLVGLLVTLGTSQLAGQTASTAVAVGDPGLKKVAERILPGLVKIEIVTRVTGFGRVTRKTGSGSGFIIDEQGHVCTNHHVAGNADVITCILPDGEEIPAVRVGTDPVLDVCVLKLKLDKRTGDSKIQPCVWGDSGSLQLGSKVYVCGSPAGISQTIASGKVINPEFVVGNRFKGDSWKASALDGEAMGSLTRWIGHDADSSGGSSGGPLANEEGEVVGITQVGIGSTGGAIPAADAIAIVDQLIKFGKPQRSFTGLTLQKPLASKGSGTQGVLVGGVMDDSPASLAGIQAGDLIINWGDAKLQVKNDVDLVRTNSLVANTPIGENVPVQLIRGDENRMVNLKTIFRERRLGEVGELNSWGITGRNITDMMARERNLDSRKGVTVDSVKQGGPAVAGSPALKTGDVITKVNGRTVVDLADLRRLSRELTEGQDGEVQILATVKRGKEEVLSVINIGREPELVILENARYATLEISTQVFDVKLAKLMGLDGVEGVRVTSVIKGGAGEKAGLKVGDVIAKLDGRIISASHKKDKDVFGQKIREMEVGSTVALSVLRDGKPLEITAQLVDEPIGKDRVDHYKDKFFGVAVRELTAKDREKGGLTKLKQGVIVEEIDQGSWFLLTDIVAGDVLLSLNGSPLEDVGSFRKQITKIREQRPGVVNFSIRRGIRTYFRQIRPEWPENEDD